MLSNTFLDSYPNGASSIFPNFLSNPIILGNNHAKNIEKELALTNTVFFNGHYNTVDEKNTSGYAPLDRSGTILNVSRIDGAVAQAETIQKDIIFESI